jgi:carbonic anhydrase
MLTSTTRRLAMATMLSIGILASASSAFAQEPAEWGYEGATGPEHWGSLDPAFAACEAGTAQSPVDIPADAAVVSDVSLAYDDSALTIADNGHAIQVDVDHGSSATIGGTEHALEQLHFHSPSEHTIGGQHADLEMHLVHADAQGGLAVVGVLLVEGEENPAFDPIWGHLPASVGEPATIEGVRFEPLDFLPDDLRAHGYHGSLTTPPCTEGVLWRVLVEPVELSAEQIARYRAIHDSTSRPVQPMGERDFLE